MMFPDLDASGYKHSGVFYNTEFESILSRFVDCYHLMKSNHVMLINNENIITDFIVKKFLKKEDFKRRYYPLENYLFDKEIEENTGRIDIRIMPIKPFINDEAYYIIECKRLNNQNVNGTSGLNGEYIKEGIDRFVSGKYSTHYKTNGMIGFVVEKMDIADNINSINALLKTEFKGVNTLQYLRYIALYDGFMFSYFSLHKTRECNISLYHLMFDFAGNIQ